MLHLIPIDRKPLENPEGYVYSGMAFDGIYFYCCTGKSGKVFKLNIEGKLVCCIVAKRAYASICFDCAENCFWAIAAGHRKSIFKLDGDLCEIGCINLPRQDRWYQNIFYDVVGDTLLLCSGGMVVKISKSGILLPLYNGEKNVQHQAATQMLDSYLIGCKFQIGGPNIIGVLCPNHCFEYLACLPRQFLLHSMCMGYEHDGAAVLFVLAAQSSRYSYLLAYRPACSKKLEKCCPPLCGQAVNDNQVVCVAIDKMDVQTDIVI